MCLALARLTLWPFMHTGLSSTSRSVLTPTALACMRRPVSVDAPSGPAPPTPPLQFDTYRLMRDLCDGDWRGSCLQVLAIPGDALGCDGAASFGRSCTGHECRIASHAVAMRARCHKLCMHTP